MASILNATTTSGLVTSADNSGSLQLQTNNGTTAVTIDTSQNVGIGTTATSGYGKVNIDGDLYFGGTSGASYKVWNRQGGALIFGTNDAERMRITSGGELCVNTTSASLFSTTWQTVIKGSNCFAVNNTSTGGATTAGFQASNYTGGGANVINFYNGSGSVAGNISVPTNASTGTTVAYNTSSDYRMKENIAPMTGALNKVLQLNPVTYTWKSNGYAGQGFIAHELQAIVPDCVSGEKDAVDAEGNPIYQGVDTSFLVATLTAAIQELKAELDATKAEVQALKGVA